MKKVLALIAVYVAFLCTGVIAGDIKECCMKKWGSDYVQAKYCVDQQVKAANVFYNEYWNKYKDCTPGEGGEKCIERDVCMKCYGKWTDAETKCVDFTMVVHCIKTQLAAFRSLQRTR